jgi:membrane protein required for colicin V production
MNTLDLIVILVVVCSGLFAFVRGFVRETLSILAWVGAGLVAYYGYEKFKPAVGRLVPNPLAAQLTTAGVLFVVSLLVFSVLVGIVSDRVRTSRLGSVDRSLGLIFGLARGVLVVCVGYIVAVRVIEPGDKWPPDPEGLPGWMAEANSRPYLDKGAKPLADLVPQRLIDRGTAATQSVDSAAKAKQQLDDSLNALKPAEPPPQPPAYDNKDRQDLTEKVEQSTGNKN